MESQSCAIGKLVLALSRAVVAVAATAVMLRYDRPLVGDTAGAATPSPRDDGHAGAGGENRQADDPDLPRIFGAHGIDPQHHAAGQGSGYMQQQHVPDGTDVKEGDLLYTHRSARLSGGARSGQGAGAARRGRARLCARQSRPRHVARQERLPRQGHLRAAQQRRGQAEARGDGRGGGAHGRAQPRLHARSARPSPAGSAAIRRRSAPCQRRRRGR